MNRTVFKKIVCTAAFLMLLMCSNVFAAQNRFVWVGSGTSWKVFDNDTQKYLVDEWYMDYDGQWYYLGADSLMRAGVYTDVKTGKTYLLNPGHDGTYGCMLTEPGFYEVNGKEVYLDFHQLHDGFYGALNTKLESTVITSFKRPAAEEEIENELNENHSGEEPQLNWNEIFGGGSQNSSEPNRDEQENGAKPVKPVIPKPENAPNDTLDQNPKPESGTHQTPETEENNHQKPEQTPEITDENGERWGALHF